MDEIVNNSTDDNADYIEEIERSPCELDIVQRLQAENAALRDELQALRSITQLQGSKPDLGTRDTFDFLGLPRELRNAIYELCVVVGEVRINRRGSLEDFDMRYDDRRDPRAAVQLFRVNKQVRSEALELYLSKNHFVVPAAFSRETCDPFRYIPGAVDSESSHSHLRSISISLDGGNDHLFITRPEIDAVHYAQVEYREYHDSSIFEQQPYLRTILEHVFSEEFQLRRLQIDISHVQCVLGCHRLTDYVFHDDVTMESIENWVLRNNHERFKSLDFLGAVDDAERELILDSFPSDFHDKITFDGQVMSAPSP